MSEEKITYCKSVHGPDEIEAVVKCLSESTQMGKYSRKLESEVAKLFSKKHSLYVNSGSSALYIGIESFGFPAGSEVITPALTFSTTIGCLIKNDLIPVFVDVEPQSYCIDVDLVEAMISDKTVAILAPNLIGNVCRWPELRELADRYELVLIEDSADTIGATINGHSSGYYSDMSITSFYGSHVVNCAGNGGALALNDDKVTQNAKLLRSWGRSSSLFDENSESIENRFNVELDGIEYDAKFVFERVGYNLEGSEIGASFGLVQLEKLKRIMKERQENFKLQMNFFDNYSEYFLLPKQTELSETAWMMFPVIIKENIPFNRKEFQIYLEKHNVQTRPVFTGNVTRQPMCKNINMKIHPAGLQNADSVMRGGVLLPVHNGMNQGLFERFFSIVTDFIDRY